MNVGNKLLVGALPLALSASVLALQPASAQQAAEAPQSAAAAVMAPGARIKDTKGGDVGTVVRADGQFVVLRTDRHEVQLPRASFTPHEGAFLIAMTRDELNADVDKTLAQADEKLVAGASVIGSQGSPVGTIDGIDDQHVTLKLTSGKLVKMPRSGIAPGPNGAVIGMTADQLAAAAQ